MVRLCSAALGSAYAETRIHFASRQCGGLAICDSHSANIARPIAPTSSHSLIVSRSAPIVLATSVALKRLRLWREISVCWMGCTIASFSLCRGESIYNCGPLIKTRQLLYAKGMFELNKLRNIDGSPRWNVAHYIKIIPVSRMQSRWGRRVGQGRLTFRLHVRTSLNCRRNSYKRIEER